MLLCFDLKIIPLFTATYPNTETKDHHDTYFDAYSKCTIVTGPCKNQFRYVAGPHMWMKATSQLMFFNNILII